MTQSPFRMDPSARFEDEVARIARENNADVVIKLVDSPCWVHEKDQPREASHVATIHGPGPRDHVAVNLCDEHATALGDHDYEKLAENAKPLHAKNLEAADKNKDVKIEINPLSRDPGRRQPGGDWGIVYEPRDPAAGRKPPGPGRDL